MQQAVDPNRELQLASLQEMTQTLVDVVSRPGVAYIAGVRSLKTVTRWTTGEVTSIRDNAVEQRIINAYQVVKYLQDEDTGNATIRMFMYGMNPTLHDEAPISVLARGEAKQVMNAAINMVWGNYE